MRALTQTLPSSPIKRSLGQRFFSLLLLNFVGFMDFPLQSTKTRLNSYRRPGEPGYYLILDQVRHKYAGWSSNVTHNNRDPFLTIGSNAKIFNSKIFKIQNPRISNTHTTWKILACRWCCIKSHRTEFEVKQNKVNSTHYNQNLGLKINNSDTWLSSTYC